MRKPSRRGSHGSGLKSLRKAIRVLASFSLKEPRLPLSEIGRRAGLPLSTAHRILATLHAEGFVDRDADREQYRLGIRLLELGSIVLSTMELHREALPFIESLAHESGETVHLGVFDGAQVVSIHKMDSPHGLAHARAISRSTFADGHVRGQPVRRNHLLDRDDLGAVKDAEVHRLATLDK